MSQIVASAILIAAKSNKVYKPNWLKDKIGIDEKSLEECCKEEMNFMIIMQIIIYRLLEINF